MSSDLVRLINLVEVLKEDLEAAGAELPDDLSDEQLQSMSEADIKQHYSSYQQSSDCSKIIEALEQPSRRNQTQQLDETQMKQLQQVFPPQGSTAAFSAWFPALFSSRGQVPSPGQPKAVVVCFHSSGNAEDMYTLEGTGSRRVQSALLAACKAHDWLLLAPQLPGRAQRLQEQPVPTLQAVAQELLPLIAPAVIAAGGKFGIVGHSLGCWAAYEVMLALREAGLPDPTVVCFSAMPWPHMPLADRPWRQQKPLSEAQFKEECRGWDINEAVFNPGMWEMYQPMLRADFSLFDEYEPSVTHLADAEPFASRMRLFWGERDRRVTQDMVKAWAGYASEASDVHISSVSGSHLWPISEPAAKAAWLKEVADALQGALL